MLPSGGAIVTNSDYLNAAIWWCFRKYYNFHLNSIVNNTDFHMFATATIWFCYPNYEA